MAILPIAEFMPDLPDMPSNGTDTANNVLPLTPMSYGPMPSLQAYSTALTARCQGAVSISDLSRNVRVFAGDATKLYRMTSASTTPANVSKVGSYSTASNGQWSFALFGNRVIATNFVDAPQSYVEGSSALFADLITSGTTSLKARIVANVKDWIVFGNTYDTTNGYQSQRVWWSSINDPTNFPTPGTTAAANNLSDFQDLPGNHGEVRGILGNLGTATAAVFMERAVFRMNYAGYPDIFDFQPAEGATGLIAQGALCQHGPIAYYWSEDGLKAFDGSVSRPIGKNKVDRFLYNDLRSDYLDRISFAADPSRGLIYGAYAGSGASNGVANRLFVYSPVLDRFTVTEANAVNIEWLLRGATFGYTLEQLDAFGTIDSLPYSLDSQVWQGGRTILSAFDSNHKFGYFDGSNLAAKVETSDFEPVDGKQTVINRARPLVDNSAATLSIGSRDTISASPSYGTDATQEANGSCAVRGRGRYHRGRIKTAAGATWTHISGVDLEDVRTVGTR